MSPAAFARVLAVTFVVLGPVACGTDAPGTDAALPEAAEAPSSAEAAPAPPPDLATVGAALMDALAAERRDEAWATKKEKSLESLGERTELPAGSEVSARCGAAICRVALRFPPGTAQQALRKVRFDDAFAESGFMTNDPDDPAVVVIFVGREDTMLNEHPGFLRALAERAPRRG